jgi:hypothetical protein
MKHYFQLFAALVLSLMGSVFAPVAKATEWDKQTNITINEPIEIQDTVLPAGSYVIRLLDSASERYVVQIFNAAQDHLITTVMAIPTYKSTAPDNSEFKFYEIKKGQPAMLHTWFYPGDNTGFEFRPGPGRVEAQSGQKNTNTAAAIASNN